MVPYMSSKLIEARFLAELQAGELDQDGLSRRKISATVPSIDMLFPARTETGSTSKEGTNSRKAVRNCTTIITENTLLLA